MGELTVIPSSQPRCTGSADDPNVPLSQTNPTPYCPASPAGPLGCFIQSDGLYCALLSTTRGFLYSPPTTQSNQTDVTTLLPYFSFPSPPSPSINANSTNGTALLPGFAHIGESCASISLPSDTTLRSLVTWAALSSLEAAAYHSPLGLGQGADAEAWFAYRSDCERGTYCDTQASQDSGKVCKEQLPNYHSCSSYMQCLSLRCDTLEAERSAAIVDPRPLSLSGFSKRAAGRTVCLPRSYPKTGQTDNSNMGNNGSNSDTSSTFRPWMGGLLAALVVIGGLVIFVLVRRRNRRENSRKILMKEMERQAEADGGALAATVGASGDNKASLQERRATTHSNNDNNNNDVHEKQDRQSRDTRPSLQLQPSLPTPDDGSTHPFATPSTLYSSHQLTNKDSRIPSLTFHRSPPPIITTVSPPLQEPSFDGGDEALLMPQRPAGHSLRTSSSSLTTSSFASSASSSPRLGSSNSRFPSTPVSPISPISPSSGTSLPKFDEGYFDPAGPSTPTARRSQRASHVHGVRKPY